MSKDAREREAQLVSELQDLNPAITIGVRMPNQPARPPTSDEEVGQRFFDNDESLRKALHSRLKPNYDRLQDHEGMSTESRIKNETATARFLSDAQLSHLESDRLHSQITHHLLEPPDDATVQQWTIESRRLLREKYGTEDAERRMAKVRAFVAEHPKIKQQLDKSGFGSHPELVLRLAEGVHRFRTKATNNGPAQ